MAAQNLDGTKIFDCDGPNSKFVELISKEGEKFFLKRKYAIMSPKIKEMLSDPGVLAETSTNKINLQNIKSVILVEVCKYLKYKYKNLGRIVNFSDPIFEIQRDIAVELMVAAHYLQC